MADNAAAKKRPRRPTAIVAQNRLIKQAIWFVIAASVVAAGGLFALAFAGSDPSNPHKATLANVCDFVLRSSIPTVIGLVSGRGVAAHRVDPPPSAK